MAHRFRRKSTLCSQDSVEEQSHGTSYTRNLPKVTDEEVFVRNGGPNALARIPSTKERRNGVVSYFFSEEKEAYPCIEEETHNDDNLLSPVPNCNNCYTQNEPMNQKTRQDVFIRRSQDDRHKVLKRISVLRPQISNSERRASIFLSVMAIAPRTQSILDEDHATIHSKVTYKQSRALSLVEDLPEKTDFSFIFALINLLPCLQGNATFSMPYIVATAGFVVLPIIPLLSYIADMTAGLLIDCLYEISPRSGKRKRVRKNYVDVVRVVWGEKGAMMMTMMSLFYLYSSAILNVLLLSKCVYDIFRPYVSITFVTSTLVTSLLLYPTLFVTKLTTLAYLSMISVFAITTGIVASVYVFITQHEEWSAHIGVIPVLDIENFLFALGVVMFSCTLHSIAPQVERNMQKRSRFSSVLHVSYISSSVVKTAFAFIGAITFGATTQSIVTLNVGGVNSVARFVCSISLSAHALFNYPLNMFVVCDYVDSIIANSKYTDQNKFFYTWVAVTRLMLVTFSVFVALVVPYFGILLAIRGSLIGTCLMFTFPCYFHLKLKWTSLSRFSKMKEIAVLIFGTLIGCIGLYSSVRKLALAMQTNSE